VDCVFCKIVNKEIPANIVYENDSVIVFMDIQPISLGHCLVIPKQHFETISDTPDSVASEIMVKAKELAPKIAKSVGAEGFNFGINTGSVAGQAVMHAHMHIIPRFKDDGLRHWPAKGLSAEEIKKAGDKIVSFLKE